MTVLASPIVGRDDELAALQRFVAAIGVGPASFVLEGVAGIGKTAIWAQAVAQARVDDVTVRSCRCSESDTGWAFAGLGDLLEGLDANVLAPLPDVQRQGLSAALLLSDSTAGSPGERVVAVAVLGVLRALAREAPLLLAVDDVQWLDASSRKVLSFALRRLGDAPVRLLVSCRTGLISDPADAAEAADAADLGLAGERLVVGPVSIGILQRIVQERLSHTLSRPTLTRLHRATGGNPMLALEMARALQRRGREPAADEQLSVPADLRVLVTERLRGLTEPTRRLLLLIAVLAHPTVAAVTAAAGDAEQVTTCLGEAVAAGVLELDGERIRFTHPLIASIPYADLVPGQRRELHERLSRTVTDPEERARHAALGSDEPSSDVAAALDVAARRARARGSIDAASELADLAVARTPAGDTAHLLRRTVDAAKYLFLLGDAPQARSVLTVGLDAARPGPARVAGLLLQATIASWEQGDATVEQLCEQAVTEADGDDVLLARCHATWAEMSPSGAAMDLIHAETAVRLLDGIDAPPADVLANALTNVAVHGCRLGRGLEVVMLERAVALQAAGEPVPVSDRAAMALGMYLKVVDRFDDSRVWLQRMRTSAVDEGDDSALPFILGHLAMLECWAGSYHLALSYAVEGREHAARMGLRAPMAQSAHVLALAHQGRLGEARDLGQSDVAADESLGFIAAVALHLRSLGFTELSAGNPAAAAQHLLRALAISSEHVGVGEPAILRLHGDAVAALVAVGRLDEAQQLTDQLDASTHSNRLPWSTAMAARCHGLLSATAGDSAGAIRHLERSLADHQLLPMPFEEARTRMILGGVLRRAGQRNAARQELDAARDQFVRLATPIQTEQAGGELASLGGWPNRPATLTPVEERIAALVGAGQTNKEVAGSLFISARTVESHLVRIYRKLGIRSRTELARRLPP